MSENAKVVIKKYVVSVLHSRDISYGDFVENSSKITYSTSNCHNLRNVNATDLVAPMLDFSWWIPFILTIIIPLTLTSNFGFTTLFYGDFVNLHLPFKAPITCCSVTKFSSSHSTCSMNKNNVTFTLVPTVSEKMTHPPILVYQVLICTCSCPLIDVGYDFSFCQTLKKILKFCLHVDNFLEMI